ncbi:four helix bundle protein [Patescibacteria group bacterium]|nr:four helix bundle protein [Patescibacteria group bacterium]
MNFDLEERTAKFGEDVIVFLRTIPRDEITRPLISQLIRSATSVGANYCEANEAASKKDFRNKVCISRKEAHESKHWLRMVAKAVPKSAKRARELWKEAHELTLIFASITKKCSPS